MSKYIFKTDINCIGCASQIKPHLDKLEQEGQIKHWQVHLTDPDHTLEIETSNMALEEVRTYVQNAGFKAEPIQQATDNRQSATGDNNWRKDG